MLIKEVLHRNIDFKYRDFSKNLLPNNVVVLGVRLPVLRKIAKSIALGDYDIYFANATCDSFEEIMLQGMVIGNLKLDFFSLVHYIDNFVLKIDNWSVCDSFVASLKITNKYKDEMFEYIVKYANSSEYEVRFMIVMFIWYYIEDEYIERIFFIIDNINNDAYYVRMAIAWLISVCYVKYEDLTVSYLFKCKLDDFTYNKALQKIIESNRVDKCKKDFIRGLKRK